MRHNDAQIGAPSVLYKDTKSNIEALSGIAEAAVAYATDTDELGTYDGSSWTWGSVGSGATDSPFIPAEEWHAPVLTPADTGELNRLFTWRFDDTTIETVATQIYVTNGGQSYLSFDIYYAMQSASSGNIEWNAYCDIIREGNTFGTYTNRGHHTYAVPGVAQQLDVATFDFGGLTGLAPVQAGDLVRIVLQRLANDASDTATGDAHFLGAKINLSTTAVAGLWTVGVSTVGGIDTIS